MRRSVEAGRWARLGGCALLLSLPGCDAGSGSSAAAPPPPKVTVAEVTEGPVPIVMQFSGTVQSVKTVEIIPRVSGYIEKRSFVEGAEVETGDPLYKIDPRPFQAALDQLNAQLAVNQANSTYWGDEAKRYAEAVRSGAVRAYVSTSCPPCRRRSVMLPPMRPSPMNPRLCPGILTLPGPEGLPL
jgi:multidrug efflux pump subunit AcrA (membrane-fusion protein)